MNKLKIIFALAFILTGMFFVSAGDSSVCCEQTTLGPCKDVPINQKDDICMPGSAKTTSCEETAFCKAGTCVNENEGTCTPNTAELVCNDKRGTWYDATRDEIPACQRGCCMIGLSGSFVTEVDCKRTATKYGVGVEFRSDIKTESACIALATSKEYGACVIDGVDGSKPCTMETKDDCKATKGSFYKDMLCSAQGLSDCAKSSNTACFDDDVYFLDICGNRANVWDNSKLTDTNYWNKIQDPTCSGPQCGDCDYGGGSVCEVKKGKAQCKDVSCEYDINGDGKIQNNEKFQNGESWCADTEGTYSEILIDPETHEFKSQETRKILEEGYETLNVPGSRYATLRCQLGEVIQEDCMDFRNQICKEFKMENDFDQATCVPNKWRGCFDLVSKTGCESPEVDCKWMGGDEYNWGSTLNGTVYPWDGKSGKEKDVRKEVQGTCVPLYAPGIDFWSEDWVDSATVCSLGGAAEVALYETGIFTDRDNFEDWSTKSAAKRCFDGSCYAIPDYGLKAKGVNDLDKTLAVHLGNKGPGGDRIKDLYLSIRKGYYCDGDTGRFTDRLNPFKAATKGPKCAESSRKRAEIPLFLNHGLWIDYIQKRARSIGDCGYKKNVGGIYGQETSEVLTVEFSKLKQSGAVKTTSDAKNVYIGDRRTTAEDDRYRSSGLYNSNQVAPFYWRNFDWWKKVNPGIIPNIGEENPVNGSRFKIDYGSKWLNKIMEKAKG